MTNGDISLEVDIVIAAYNEQLCISDILQDVVSSSQSDWFQVQNIYVVSDASTDQTDDIVRRCSQSDDRVQLIRKPGIKGNNDSINRVIRLTNSDALVMLDADVRANENVLRYMVQPIYKGQAALVGANVIPAHPGAVLNPARRARHFDGILEGEIRRIKPISYWSFYGRALAMSRDLYQNLVLPDSHADDLFIYYFSRKKGYKLARAEDAVVYFEAPNSIGDFVDQYSRFMYHTEKARERFGAELVDNDMKVPGMAGFLVSSFIRHPYGGLMWAVCKLAAKIMHLFRYKADKLDKGLYKTKSRRKECW
jgi:glycosyltransferase involved in cell wall biosynthesis